MRERADLYFLRLQSRAVTTFLVRAPGARCAVLNARWEIVVALVASVVRYGICSECISRVSVRVLVLVGTMIDELTHPHSDR